MVEGYLEGWKENCACIVLKRDFMRGKMNCWEYKKCGREPGGERVKELGVCPAAVDSSADGLNGGKNGGRICWAIAGTFCGGEEQCSFALNKITCLKCDFFELVRKEEGARFRILKPVPEYDYNLY